MKDMLRLLERYYDGLTTPEEERRLRQWLESDGCPDAYAKDREAIRLLAEPQPAPVPDGLAEQLTRTVRRAARRRVLRVAAWGVAAGLALLLALDVTLRAPAGAEGGRQTAMVMADDTLADDVVPPVRQEAASETCRSDSAAAVEKVREVRPVRSSRTKRGIRSRRHVPVMLPPARYYAEQETANVGPALAAAETGRENGQEEELSDKDRELLRRLAAEHIRELLELREYARRVVAQSDFDFSIPCEDDEPETVVIE